MRTIFERYLELGSVRALADDLDCHGLRTKARFLVTPGSERVFQTIKRDGVVETFGKIDATVLANACGPCIGQWDRTGLAADTPNTIVNSFNRNFPRRNDGRATTKAFVASPQPTESSGVPPMGRSTIAPPVDARPPVYVASAMPAKRCPISIAISSAGATWAGRPDNKS